MVKEKIVKVGCVNNQLFHLLGLTFMAINKVRHSVRGYRNPRTFSAAEIARSVEYSVMVCDEWQEECQKHTGIDDVFSGKDVLEAGPGPDVGNGLVMIARGACSYTAIDRFNLVPQTRSEFYEKLLEKLRKEPDYERALEAYRSFSSGTESALRYVWDTEFKLRDLRDQCYDLVVSRAAMEHFDDVAEFLQATRRKLRPGSWIVSLVDMKTHTRYLRDEDPMNILRYGDWTYRLLGYPGAPNRLRLGDYLDSLERAGFSSITWENDEIVDDDYLRSISPHLNRRYRDRDDLGTVGAWIIARA
jgi:SAM-dependent methyltransferase